MQRELRAAAWAKETREADLKDQVNKMQMATQELEESMRKDPVIALEEQHRARMVDLDQRRQQQQYTSHSMLQMREDPRYSLPLVPLQGDASPQEIIPAHTTGEALKNRGDASLMGK